MMKKFKMRQKNKVNLRKNDKKLLQEELLKKKAQAPKTQRRYSQDFEDVPIDPKFLKEDPIFEAL